MIMPRRCLLGGLAMAPALGATRGRAQGAPRFPERTVRIVVPYTPGGAADNTVRLVAQQLSEDWGRAVAVENRPGGGSVIGTEAAMRTAPDGYTLLQVSLPFVLNAVLLERLPYDAKADFVPIGLMTSVPHVLVVHPSFPAHTVAEFVAYAKARPREVAVAHTGTGSVNHLSGELLCAMAGIETLPVAYAGSAPAHTDVLSGRVPAMFDSSMLQHIAAGRVRALGVTSAARLPMLPDVPTVAASGYPGYLAEAWYGLVAPRGTAAEITERVSADVRRLLARGEVRERLATLSLQPAGTTPAQFAAFMDDEAQRWGRLVRERRIRPDG